MEVPGYEIGQEILRSGLWVVHRGWRARDRAPVLLKTPAQVPPGGPAVESLEREFGLLRDLTLGGVPRAHELLRDGRLSCLVLEDRGLAPLSTVIAARRPSLEDTFQIALALCTILGDLHRQDIIHGGVSPSSILVGGDDGDVQLFDFGFASRSSAEVRPSALVGRSLAHVSPEQTGRMNRAFDYRTDFYSLGATLYELLTGTPPFASRDALELIHAHIARAPVSPSTLDPAIPEQLSRVVLRLLAKTAEERYQSAQGIRHDLDVCEQEWGSSRTIAPFELGRQDISDRFLVPQKLYGREREVAELLQAFERTCEGSAGLMLVSGYSGIGKTALIHELYKPIVRQRGYFVSGKFDQVVRNIPYNALIQAFRDLVRQLLTESEERLSVWRVRLSGALGANGGVLAEVIPEIELVLGKQPPVPPLDPAEAQNRFRFVFQSFVETVAQKEHPLVVFLDDLQWVDAATLDLLHTLMTGAEIHHLLLIGAYRDNEVDAGHLLMWALGRLEAAGTPVGRVSLAPLSLPDLTHFLSDTLHSGAEDVAPLARLILQKTDGNPFFVIQFLRALYQDGQFVFDHARRRWSFRLDAIAGAGVTDNVIDLMTRKILQLSPQAQTALTLAACIGNPFSWHTYLVASRQSPEDAAAALREPLDAGLILAAASPYDSGDAPGPANRSFLFLHDRVQQAAYGLMAEDRRREVHLDVGRLLLAEFRGEVADAALFEVVNHLNTGRALVSDDGERVALARLNLSAGRKAKTSAAYRAASGYFAEGIALVDDGRWASDYELMFDLYREAAECEYLAGDFERAERHFALLLTRARARTDRAEVHCLRSVLYENQSRYREAVSSGRNGLALFGIALPDSPSDAQAALDAEVAAIQSLVGERRLASLADLPLMSDPDIQMVMRILTGMWAPSYLAGDEILTRVISATMVRLSLEHGNTEDSAYGYVTHAITIGPVRGDYRAAYEWGELALRVNDRLNDARRRAKIHQQFQAHVNLWRRPLETCIPHAREACRSGLETGDFTYAGYGAFTETWPALLSSRDLDRFVRTYTPTVALLEKIRMADFMAAQKLLLNWARALQGRTAGRLSLSDAGFDEDAYRAAYEGGSPFFLTFLYTARLHLALLFGAAEEASRMATLARGVALAGTIWPVLADFWGSLAHAAVYPTLPHTERAARARDMAASREALRTLAENCPENFRCAWLLVSAEMQRVESRPAEAGRLYEEAIAYARQTGDLQNEALANELYAGLLTDQGRQALAAGHMTQAHRGYAAWGAWGKVADLEERFAGLISAAPAAEAAVGSLVVRPAGEPDGSLDMSTVLKVAQAIAVEIELDDLLRKLMKIALENAGAERGMFLLERDGRLVLEAEAAADRAEVTVGHGTPVEEATNLSHGVVRYVRRTGEGVVIGDAASDERFAADTYVTRGRARSILCVPVGTQGRPVGLLYLENSLTADAFTPERIEMMRVLAAQAAISLENARLYEETKAEAARRTEAEQALREAMTELEGLKNRLEAENVYLQEEIRTQHNFNEILGNSPPLLDALHRVERVAPTESTVLIVGETGAGKELFARAIHSRSNRKDRPLVKVNCGAIPPGLVESELFGHVKGAFTGAIEKRIGRFELANRGTIFLDEVGELPLDAQVKLLRVLQEQEFEPVGSSRTIRVDVRVIAATNRDLDEAVRQGRFRADLLYRLNVLPIEVPPLRMRQADIPLLVNYFVAGLSRRVGKPIRGFSARSMERMMSYAWPGNVRELQNVVERAAILASGPVLELEDELLGLSPKVPDSEPAPPQGSDTLEDVQRAHIESVLKMTGGVVEGARGAATILGMHPNTLRSRMKKLGITLPGRGAS